MTDGDSTLICEDIRYAKTEEKTHLNEFLSNRRDFLSDLNNGLIIIAGSYELALNNLYRFEKKNGHKINKDEFLQCLKDEVKILRKQGFQIIFIAPVPFHSVDSLQAYRRYVGKYWGISKRETASKNLDIGYPREEHDRRTQNIMNLLTSIEGDGISIFNPANHLCPNKTCFSINKGQAMTWDRWHLSDQAINIVLQELLNHISNFNNDKKDY